MEAKREKIKNRELEEAISKLRQEVKNNSGGQLTIPAFTIEQTLYKSQLQKLTNDKEEYRRMVQQFWVEEKMYKIQIQKLQN